MVQCGGGRGDRCVWGVVGVVMSCSSLIFPLLLPAYSSPGALFEFFGYGMRLYSREHVDTVGLYIATLLPILLAPTVLAAADYALVSDL